MHGLLSQDAMARTCRAIEEFKAYALREGAQSVHCFATAAVRSARNGGDFTSLVREKTGVTVDVISGEEEAAIGLSGALGNADGGIIDIGGGSAELTLRAGGRVTYSKSLDVGAVRLYDLFGRDYQRADEFVKEKIKEYGEVKCDVPLYGIGGTATSLAALAQGLKEYDPKKVQDYKLTVPCLETTLKRIVSVTPEKLTEESCLPLKRAEIVGGGALFLLRLCEYLGISEMIVSERDNLEGYLFTRIIK